MASCEWRKIGALRLIFILLLVCRQPHGQLLCYNGLSLAICKSLAAPAGKRIAMFEETHHRPMEPITQAEAKQMAAERAVDFVQSDMRIGLGTGSTAIWATRRIAALLHGGQLQRISGFATSKAVAEEAQRLGIPLLAEELALDLDLTIDGADEVDPALNLIKGGGGALLREKIVAQASHRVIIVVDESKLSPQLGTKWALPVEVLPFAWRSQARFLESLGAQVKLRTGDDGAPFQTDQGNLILDCNFGPLANPAALAARLSARAGLLEHGLFLGLATDLIVAGSAGVRQERRGD
jgi:ribose 5-phosphate isomerase A